MKQVVWSIKNLLTERNRYQRSRRTFGEVTENSGFTVGYRENPERRLTEKRSSFWAGELQGG